jgi:hypothetical protein
LESVAVVGAPGGEGSSTHSSSARRRAIRRAACGQYLMALSNGSLPLAYQEGVLRDQVHVRDQWRDRLLFSVID